MKLTEERIREIVKEELSKMKAVPSTPTPSPKKKAKREPSAYNKFVKEKFTELKKDTKFQELPNSERLKKISQMWKESKK
jgi:hypothetical protein